MPDKMPENPKTQSAPMQQHPQQAVPVQHTATTGIRPEIGIWGPPSTGKTVFLAAALRSLERVKILDKHYHLKSPLDQDKGETQQSIDLAKTFLTDIRAKLDDDAWPAPTAIDTNKTNQPFSLYLTLPDDGSGTMGRYHKLRLFDVAGEHTRADKNHPYWQHLSQVRVILFIVDADFEQTKKWFLDKNTGYNQLITDFMNNIRGRNPSLAIVITKADTQNPQRNIKLDEQGLLKNIIGEDASRSLFDEFPKHKIFITSAAGWCIDPKDSKRIIPNVTKSEDGTSKFVRKDSWRPYNLAYTLAWVMDQLEESRLAELNDSWRQARFIRQYRKTNMQIIEEYHERNRPKDGANDPLYYMP